MTHYPERVAIAYGSYQQQQRQIRDGLIICNEAISQFHAGWFSSMV